MADKFEAIFPAGAAANSKGGKQTFSPGVRVGDTIWISGMTAGDERGHVVGVGDMGAQCRYIYQKMAKILEAAGGSLRDVVQTTDYVTTFENYRVTADIRREVFGEPPYPTATGIQVSALVRQDALIEISAVAVLGCRS
jgi:enamine deaminase RidA (YjgF/YER057c/UK114 family)